MSRTVSDLSPERRVVITGFGMVTPLGIGVESTWSGLIAGRSAVAPIRRFDASSFPVTFAAECTEPTPPPALAAHHPDLKSRITIAAALEALSMADWIHGGPRTGVCVGSEAGRPDLAELASRMRSDALPSLEELKHLAPAAPTRLAATLAGAEGPQSTISTACTSSSQAIGEAMTRIRDGEVDSMIAGGVDVLVDPLMVTGFSLLGALSTRNDAPERASRPFDIDRDGFVLGEGAGFVVLESLARAQARKVEPLAELSGFGCSCNAYRITDSPPDGRGAFQSMSAALRDSGLQPSDIGYINAHGTSTQMNDVSETRGIHRAMGASRDRIPVSSTKSMMGHLVAACGAVELIISTLALRRGLLPPTINLDRVDPGCGVDHVRHQARPSSIRHAMTNAFGFGGSNGTLIVSAWP